MSARPTSERQSPHTSPCARPVPRSSRHSDPRENNSPHGARPKRSSDSSLPNVRRLNRWSSNAKPSASARTGSPGRFPAWAQVAAATIVFAVGMLLGIAQGTNGAGSPRRRDGRVCAWRAARIVRRRMYRKHRWRRSNAVCVTRWRPFESRTRTPWRRRFSVVFRK